MFFVDYKSACKCGAENKIDQSGSLLNNKIRSDTYIILANMCENICTKVINWFLNGFNDQTKLGLIEQGKGVETKNILYGVIRYFSDNLLGLQEIGIRK